MGDEKKPVMLTGALTEFLELPAAAVVRSANVRELSMPVMTRVEREKDGNRMLSAVTNRKKKRRRIRGGGTLGEFVLGGTCRISISIKGARSSAAPHQTASQQTIVTQGYPLFSPSCITIILK